MTEDPLKILHVFRAPVGGLFRHVLDLTRQQIARGHAVGMVMDSTTGGPRIDELLAQLAPQLALGVTRTPMLRLPHWTDIAAQRHVNARVRETGADVVHGHGSKGGFFARLPGVFSSSHAIRCYTPHGGSFHYREGTQYHRLFMITEQILHRGTDLLLFESEYIRRRFLQHVGAPHCHDAIVLNGISASEFEPVRPDAEAADFLYVGELRPAKGVDTLLKALAKLTPSRSLALVGSGPDEAELRAQAHNLGVADRVAFLGAMPAREAFRKGRILVSPSRAESLPYVSIEAAGAQVPIVATNVGGMPEIFGPYADKLISAGNDDLLAERMKQAVDASPESAAADASDLSAFVSAHFRVEQMAEAALHAYRQAIAAKRESRTNTTAI